MLKLVNVVKTYVMGDSKVEALKGISVNFRKMNLYLFLVHRVVEKQLS